MFPSPEAHSWFHDNHVFSLCRFVGFPRGANGQVFRNLFHMEETFPRLRPVFAVDLEFFDDQIRIENLCGFDQRGTNIFALLHIIQEDLDTATSRFRISVGSDVPIRID